MNAQTLKEKFTITREGTIIVVAPNLDVVMYGGYIFIHKSTSTVSVSSADRNNCVNIPFDNIVKVDVSDGITTIVMEGIS